MLENDLQIFHRRLKLAACFEGTRERPPLPFLPPSLWQPETGNLPGVMNQLIRKFHHIKEKENLSAEDTLALKSLQSNKNIVIKPADKGSAVVIMDGSTYVNEALRQLNNTQHYKALDAPIYPDSFPSLKEILTSLYNRKFINMKQFKFLLGDDKPNERKFSIRPKIHKDPPRGFHPSSCHLADL